jgi:hypothetical protein
MLLPGSDTIRDVIRGSPGRLGKRRCGGSGFQAQVEGAEAASSGSLGVPTSAPLLGQESKGPSVARPDRSEVPAVEGDHDLSVEPLGESHDRGIGTAEREIAIALHEVADPRPILWRGCLDFEPLESSKERRFDGRTEPLADHVRHLRYDERRNDELEIGASQRVETTRMVVVVGVDHRVERPGVNDRDQESTRRRGSPRNRERSSRGRCGRAPRTERP